ncbi:MAG: DUF5107 domain-containing protein [Fimbriimonadaceae bacterium]|nr:DUF5107 domain-containing protein [Fimbriimonadaceae bacterium]
MASSVEETVFECEALDVVERAEIDPRSYPYRRLEVSTRVWRPSMRSVELDNPWVHAIFAPELGGRIVSLRRGRAGEELLAGGDRLEPRSTWGRGGIEHARDAYLDHGVQLLAPDRGNVSMPSLSPVETLISPPMDEDEAASVVMAGLAGGDLAFHVVAELPPDRAELVLEARFFNRSLTRPSPYSAAWRAHVPGFQPFRDHQVSAAVHPSSGAGLAWIFDPRLLREPRWDGEGLEIGRHPGGTLLGPRQSDVVRVALVPLQGMAGLVAATPDLFAAVQGRSLRLLSVGTTAGCRVFVLVGRETLEATLDLDPTTPHELDLPGQPEGLEVRGPDGAVLLRWEPGSKEALLFESTPVPASLAALVRPAANSCEEAYLRGAARRSNGEDPSVELAVAAIAPELRSLCHLQGAMHLLRSGDSARASREVEIALGFNAEDPLAWWLKAVADRLSGGGSDEAPELPNAHFLAPLEPALRAEAFLSQGADGGPDPNPLLAPLAEMPDVALEAVCLVLDLGLWDQAIRLTEELLRHREQPLLRYLLAYSHLRATGMEVDVAHHLGLAGAQPLQPPFPRRDVEWRALRELARHRPEDARLAEWNALASILEPRP